MNSWMIPGLPIAVLITSLFPVSAYETPTHSDMTAYAVARSVLVSDPNLLLELGLDESAEAVEFPSVVPVDEDYPMPEKTVFMNNASILRIIKAGAVLEDGSTNSLHHFYDAINGGRGLTLVSELFSFRIGMPSPDWMLDGASRTNSPMMLFQKFSYADSLEYFYKALTSAQADNRNTNFGLMFRGIGHLVHHIQDMAQPQHVRNDQHCDKKAAPVCVFNDNPSYFEKYTDKNRKVMVPFISTHVIPHFPRLREYWENTSGTGLAEFTQSNFISQGTNFEIDRFGDLGANNNFSLPVPQRNESPVIVELASLLQESGVEMDKFRKIMKGVDCDSAVKCDVGFIASMVKNAGFPASSINARASTVSLLGDELIQRKLKAGFVTTYNRLNFHAAYPYLIPRAIAYSAGMINHFFRGRLSVEFIATRPDGHKIIKVTNSSSSDVTLSAGQFEIFYDSTPGVRKPLTQFHIQSGGLPLQSGDSVKIGMVRPNDVNTTMRNPYLIVFNAKAGKMGGEGGIAASRFALNQKGYVLRVSRGATFCPSVPYGVVIAFPEQPDDGGQLFVRGDTIHATLDFRGIPSGVDVFRQGARWHHGFDPVSGEYRYEVTYRFSGAETFSCAGSILGPWLLDDDVSALTWEQIFGIKQ